MTAFSPLVSHHMKMSWFITHSSSHSIISNSQLDGTIKYHWTQKFSLFAIRQYQNSETILLISICRKVRKCCTHCCPQVLRGPMINDVLRTITTKIYKLHDYIKIGGDPISSTCQKSAVVEILVFSQIVRFRWRKWSKIEVEKTVWFYQVEKMGSPPLQNGKIHKNGS